MDIPIPVESDLDTWLGGLMAKISASSGGPLSPQLQQEGLEWDSWKAVQDFEGNWAGKVSIQCSKADDLYKLQAAVHSKGIVVEGHTTTICKIWCLFFASLYKRAPTSDLVIDRSHLVSKVYETIMVAERRQ